MIQLRALIRLRIASWAGGLRRPGAFLAQMLLWTVSLMFFVLALALAALLTQWLTTFLRAAQHGSTPIPPALIIALILSSFQLVWMLRAFLPTRKATRSTFLLALPLSLSRRFFYEMVSELFSGFVLLLLPSLFAVHLTLAFAAGHPWRAAPILALNLGFWVFLFTWIEGMVHAAAVYRGGLWGRIKKVLFGIVPIGTVIVFSVGLPALQSSRPGLHAWFGTLVYWTPSWQSALAFDGLLRDDPHPFYLACAVNTAWTVLVGLAAYTRWKQVLLQIGEASPAAGPSPRPAPVKRSIESLVMEREFKYLLRNPQVRLLLIFPFVILLCKGFFVGRPLLMSGMTLSTTAQALNSPPFDEGEATSAVFAALGWLLLVYGSLFNNQFGLDNKGAARFLLLPLSGEKLLKAKNRSLSFLFFIHWTALLSANILLYRDLEASTFWIALCAAGFALFGMSALGNFASLHFPRRSLYGERLDAGRWGVLLMLVEVPLVLLPSILVVEWTAHTSHIWARLPMISVLVPFAWAFYTFFFLPKASRLWDKRRFEVVEAVGGGYE